MYSKRLEPEHDKALVGSKAQEEAVRNVSAPAGEDRSPVHEVPPWAETYEFSSTDVDGVLGSVIDSS